MKSQVRRPSANGSPRRCASSAMDSSVAHSLLLCVFLSQSEEFKVTNEERALSERFRCPISLHGPESCVLVWQMASMWAC